MRNKRGKRGQITIFIIIAIVIVAAVLILFGTKIKAIKNIFAPSAPDITLKGCIEEELEKAIENVSGQGGSTAPELFYMYKGNKVEYLCYTNQYYKTCVMQQPLLKQHVEREILEEIKPEADKCLANVKNELIRKGFSVSSGREDVSLEIAPENIKVKISGISFTKGETGERYDKFEFNYKSEIYSFIMLTSSILNWEARYGDSDITTYMIYYPTIKLEKFKQEDGSKIYILTDTDAKESFMFATRSLSWPAGYGFGQTHKPVII